MSIVLESFSISKIYKPHFSLFSKCKNLFSIDNFSLSLKKGEIYAFLGPNGAGKTTVMRLLLGLLSSDQGRVEIHNKNMHSYKSLSGLIGYAPDHTLYYPEFTGYDHLKYIHQLASVRSFSDSQILELLDMIGLTYARDKKVLSYSYGMKQRLGLAISLLHDPDIVFWDEPMNGLDPLGRDLIKNLMLRLKAQGKTLFFSTHILSDVQEISDRFGILVDGKKVFESQTSHLNDSIHSIFEREVKGYVKNII